MPVYTVFPFSSLAKCHDFEYFGQHIDIFLKKGKIHVLGIETDPDPDFHALDADPDPESMRM